MDEEAESWRHKVTLLSKVTKLLHVAVCTTNTLSHCLLAGKMDFPVNDREAQSVPRQGCAEGTSLMQGIRKSSLGVRSAARDQGFSLAECQRWRPVIPRGSMRNAFRDLECENLKNCNNYVFTINYWCEALFLHLWSDSGFPFEIHKYV